MRFNLLEILETIFGFETEECEEHKHKPRNVATQVFFLYSTHLTHSTTMQTISKTGVTISVVGLDAAGVVTTKFDGTPLFTFSDAVNAFVFTAAADGLSATLIPTDATIAANAQTVTGTVAWSAGTLSLSEDVTYTSDVVVPPGPGVATSASFVFTPL